MAKRFKIDPVEYTPTQDDRPSAFAEESRLNEAELHYLTYHVYPNQTTAAEVAAHIAELRETHSLPTVWVPNEGQEE